jgi:hypothetical protein
MNLKSKLLLAFMALITQVAFSQSEGDFRSVTTGLWSNPATWEIFQSGSFVPATAFPTAADGAIVVKAGHTVTSNIINSLNQVTIEANAVLIASSNTITLVDVAGPEINVLGTLNLSAGTFSGTGQIDFASGSLFNLASGTINSNVVLNLAAGSITVANVTGSFFNNGTINNSGTWNMEAGNHSFSVGPAAFNNLSTGVVNLNGWQSATSSWSQNVFNSGVFNKNNGNVTFAFTSAPFTNQSGGIFNINSGEVSFNIGGSNSGSIIGQGAGTSMRTLSAYNHNSGGSISNIGALIIASGTFTAAAGSTTSVFPQLTISGGTLVLNQAWNTNALTLSSGNINGPQPVNVFAGGTFNWGNSGTIGSAGVLNLASGVVSTFNSSGSLFNSGTINNSGTWNMESGGVTFSVNPAAFNNLSGGVVNLNGWQSTTSTWQQNTTNSGVFNKNNSNVTFTFAFAPFVNASGGVFNINSGEVSFGAGGSNAGNIIGQGSGTALRTGGNYAHNSGGTISNVGIVLISGGTFTAASGSITSTLPQLTVNGGTLALNEAWNTNALTLSSGIISGPQPINVITGGTFNWGNSGSISTAGVLNLASGVVSTFNSSGSLFNSGTINNSGTWNMESGGVTFSVNPAAFNNLSGGVVNLNGWQSTTSTWQQNTTNNGVFNKNNGNVTFAFSFSPFVNASAGVFNINSGQVTFGAGGSNSGSFIGQGVGSAMRTDGIFAHNSGGSISNVGNLLISSGTFTAASGSTTSILPQLTVNGGTLALNEAWNTNALTLSSGNINGPQPINVITGGTFSWGTSGTIGTAGVLNLASGVVTTFNSAGSLTNSGTINNSGTWNMENGNITFSVAPAAFNNLATGVVNLNGWQSTTFSWGQNTTNSGVFNKNNGNITFAFTSNPFINASPGVFNINSGQVTFGAGGSNSGSFIGQGVGSAMRTDGIFAHNSGGSISNVGNVLISSGTFTAASGSTTSILPQLTVNGGTLALNEAWNTNALTLSSGNINGPQPINVITGGTFSWGTSGTIGTAGVLNLASGVVTTFNSAGSLTNSGTINNSGTWNMENGNITFSVAPAAFNNLSTGVVNLNGWQSTTFSWQQNTTNNGVFNKNNGNVTFAFSFSPVVNASGGVFNINSGQVTFGAGGSNSGSFIGQGVGSAMRTDGIFAHNSGGSISNVGNVLISSGTFTAASGSTTSILPQLTVNGGTLVLNEAWNTNALTLSSGNINGPQPVNVTSGGTFNWGNSGIIGTAGVLNLASGVVSTFNSAGSLTNSGTINNSGTWNMESGNLSFNSTPAAFNNLSTGVVNLNGWQTPTFSWAQNTANSGVFNKNNTNVTFTFSSFPFTNAASGVVNVNSGLMTFDVTFPVQNGVFNLASGAQLNNTGNFSFAGTAINNFGSIISPSLIFSGTTSQSFNGNGTVNVLNINNAAGVEVSGSPQVNNSLIFTNGKISTGISDALVLASGASVSGTTSARYVNGNVRWNYPVGSNILRIFPIGGSSAFTPLTVQFAAVNSAGTLTARSNDGDHPEVNTSLIAPQKSVNRHWSLSNTGIAFTTATATFNWIAGDVDAGAVTGIFAVSKFDNPDWAFTTVASPTATSIQATGLTAFSDFQIGEPCLAPSLSTTVADASCFGANDGAVNLIVSDGTPVFSFAWSNGATTEDLTGVPAGDYDVVVTTEGGCVANASATVGQPEILSATIGSELASLCDGEQTTINFTGPANGTITFTINGGPEVVVALNGLGNASLSTGVLSATATYALVSTSDGTCTNAVAGSAQVAVNPLPVLNCGTLADACDIDDPIALIGSPLGGTWSGVGVSNNSFDPAAGSQTLTYTFTDVNGCTNTCTTSITVIESTTWFADADNDGFGNPAVSIQDCEQPVGFVANSNDNCPNDPLKSEPGVCGCGVSDVDSDNDGTPDCIDSCPNDPNKTNPGTCGCGVADTDSDNDGIADCIDVCPLLANLEPGDPCDDGNANTGNDVVNENCVCAGVLLDCAGVPGGTAFLDNCNTCVGGNTGLVACAADCNGVFGGTAFTDNCGTCVGGNTGLVACATDCNGVFGGTAFTDNCGTCVGGNTGLNPCAADCNGVFGGTAFTDNCGTCVGGNTGLNPCAADCNGVFGGTAFTDNCGTCVGGNTGLVACAADCNGVFGGTAFTDNCGTCVGGNTGLNPCAADCNGVFGGTAFTDNCGTCVGGNTGLNPCAADCNGVFGGTAFTDNCGTCVGGNTGLVACVPTATEYLAEQPLLTTAELALVVTPALLLALPTVTEYLAEQPLPTTVELVLVVTPALLLALPTATEYLAEQPLLTTAEPA